MIKKRVCKWPPYESNEIEEAIRDNEDAARDWLELPIRTFFGKAVGKVAFIIILCKHINIYLYIKEMFEDWNSI